MTNEEKIAAKRKREKEWRANNPERLRAIKKREYEKHRNAYLNRIQRWNQMMADDPELQEEFRRAKREVKWRAKLQIIKLYGGVCQRCGFADERALQLDHIKANPLPRNTGFRGGEKLYRAILCGKFPAEDFQLLCANCNVIKRFENGEGCIKRDSPHPENIPYRRKGWWVTKEAKIESARKMWEERRLRYGPTGRTQKETINETPEETLVTESA